MIEQKQSPKGSKVRKWIIVFISLALLSFGCFLVGYKVIPKFAEKKEATKKAAEYVTMKESYVDYNSPKPAEEYTVRGIDVSNHNGDIDWKSVAKDDVAFAYIKATEGTTFTDKSFETNWNAAWKTDLKVGAYHFLRFDSSGTSQVENFTNALDNKSGMLRPMVDIEYEPTTVLPDDETALKIIDEVIKGVEDFYKVKPILYVNYDSYEKFIRGRYEDYPIWFVDINKPAKVPDGRKWTLWQYSHSERLQGVEKGITNVDFNAYYGEEGTFDQDMLVP